MALASDFVTARDAAGATYASAIGSLRAAYIELAAYDMAVRNNNLGLMNAADQRGFVGALTTIPPVLLHQVYANSVQAGWLEAVKARGEQIIGSYPGTSSTTIAAARVTAGATYLAAANAVRAAYIELAAYDEVIRSKRIPFATPPNDKSFAVGADLLPAELVHPVYANSVAPRWLEEIRPRANQILATYAGPEKGLERVDLNGGVGNKPLYPGPVLYWWYTPIGVSPNYGFSGDQRGPVQGPTGPGVPLFDPWKQ